MKKGKIIYITECISCIMLLIVSTMTITSFLLISEDKDITFSFAEGNYFVVTDIQNKPYVDESLLSLNEEERFLHENNALLVEKEKQINEVDTFIENNMDIIEFYNTAFGLESSHLVNKIKEIHYENYEFSTTNVLQSEIIYNSFDEEVYHYVINLMNTNPELFNSDHIISYESKEYIIALIDYFGKYFPSVDTSIAKAIANIESGYTVRSMLDKNNIFGGLSGGSLIPYKTIEYGVYSYMKLLNDGYFSIGLNTIETIGAKYNPVYENGVKVASPSWVTKLYNVIDNFRETTINSIDDLLSKKSGTN